MISVYSFCSSVLFYNICLGIVFLLRRKTTFLYRYTTSVLTLITVLGLIRLFTPLDLEAAHIIRSYVVLPYIVNILRTPVVGVGFRVRHVLLAAWGLGTAIFLLRDILRELRFAKMVKQYTYINSEQATKVAASFGDYTVKMSPQVSTPFVAGIFRPVIYLPCMELSDDEMIFVLRHEIQHILSHDALKKLLFLAIEALFWWNPLAHISRTEIDAILEMQCDAKLTASMNADEVYRYMRSVLAVMKQISPDGENSPLSASALLRKRSDILQRFEVMQNGKKRVSRRRHFLVSCVIVSFFALSYMVIIQPYVSMPVEDVGATVIEVTPDNAYIVYEDDEYQLYINGSWFGIPSEEELELPPLNNLEIR